MQDQVGENAPRGRRMHHSMSAKSVGEEEAAHARRRAEDGMMVGRHFVHARPAAAWIDGQIGEGRHAMGGVGQDLLNEGGIEIGAEAGLLLGVGPGHYQA